MIEREIAIQKKAIELEIKTSHAAAKKNEIIQGK